MRQTTNCNTPAYHYMLASHHLTSFDIVNHLLPFDIDNPLAYFDMCNHKTSRLVQNPCLQITLANISMSNNIDLLRGPCSLCLNPQISDKYRGSPTQLTVASLLSPTMGFAFCYFTYSNKQKDFT